MAAQNHKSISVTYCIAILFYILLQFTSSAQPSPTTASSVGLVDASGKNVIEVKLPANNGTNLGNLLQLAVSEHSEHGQECDTTANCTDKPNQICMNGRCSCKPNYALQNGECVEVSQCNLKEYLCSQQDPNRVCESFNLGGFVYSHCVCSSDFIEDPLTRICRRKCAANYYQLCEHEDDENSLCNVYRCQCKTNYRRNAVTGRCELFTCDRDSQCWTEGDKYRSCVNGTCACTYEEDPATKRCLINFTSLFKIRYYYSWRTERILLATIFIVPIVFYYCFLQNLRKAKSTIVAFRAPRPGEGFYGSQQPSIAIHSPKFMTESSCEVGQGGLETTVVKSIGAPVTTRPDPTGDCKGIKYERFM